MTLIRIGACVTFVASALALGCSGGGTGTAGSPLVRHPDVPGTVFTIVFENEDSDKVISPADPFFSQLAAQYSHPTAYTSTTHPSLPNYIMMTSGTTNGVTTDSDPGYNVTVPGSDNVADQLDATGVPWRAYMESMGDPCKPASDGLYSAHHNPFLYYWSMRMNPTRCAKQVVDFQANFTADLDSNAYRYMWITPNMCNDIHNCPTQTGDAWLKQTVTQIMNSPGYKNGGAIFILFDEGNSRLPGAGANLPVIVVSPQLVSTPYNTTTAFDHRSYLATVQDIFGMPRFTTTAEATSMDELFVSTNDTTSVDAGTTSDASTAPTP